MQLNWYYVDDKDIAASNNDFVFRLKMDIEQVTSRHKEPFVDFLSLQVRKKQDVAFYDLGYKFLITEIDDTEIEKRYVDGVVWTDIVELVNRTEEILLTLGYLEDTIVMNDKHIEEDYYDDDEEEELDNTDDEEEFPYYWTEEKINKYIELGRGSGERGEYKSWLTTDDISPNFKEAAQITSCDWIIDDVRSVHLIGTLDIGFFHEMKWERDIVDIREYYPLDSARTLQIAKELKIAHNKDKITKIPIFMVSNFLVTYEKQGKQYSEAIITSWSDKVSSKRFQNQLKIFKKYWSEKGVEVRLITENDINWTAARNHSKLFHMKTANHYILDQEECEVTVNKLNLYQKKYPTMTISEFTKEVAEDVFLTPGQILCALEFLIANRVIEFQYTVEEYNYNLPINKLNIKHTEFKVEAVLRPPRVFKDKILTLC